MPRMPHVKYLGTVSDIALVSVSQKITSPAAAAVYEFASYHRDQETYEFFSGNKIESCEDIWSGRVRVLDDKTESWAPVPPPNDWPAPFYPDDVILSNNDWYLQTQVGARNLMVCDIEGSATTVYVYDAINGPCGQINPPGGFVIKNNDRGDMARVTGRSHTTNYDIFSGMTRNWPLGEVGQPWKGHDRGSVSLGPPPVPPDTVHDDIRIKKFDKALMGFYATGTAHAACLPRPITYAPKGSRNGIFMPIILRYLSTLITKTKTTVTTTTKKAPTITPTIATGCDGSLLL